MTEVPAPNIDPRVTRTRATVLGAAIDLIAERGYAGFSVEGVVERTGVAKTTLYRHWATRDDLIADAIAKLDGGGPLPDTGSVRQDLLDCLAPRIEAARIPQWDRCMPALVEASAHHPELAAIITRLTSQIIGQIEALLQRGVARGELRDDFEPELAASTLIGPIVFRRLLLQEAPTRRQVSAVIDVLMQGIAAQPQRESVRR